MINKSEIQLLTEIAKLIKKYGPETFETLSKSLYSPEFSNHLAALLSKSATIGHDSRRNISGRTRNAIGIHTFRSTLVALAEKDRDKSAIVVKLYDDLTSKTILPTLRDIQAFLSDAGLPILKAKGRDKAIIPFIKILLPYSATDLASLLSHIKYSSTNDDRSLESWSNIILDKKRRSRN